ncbi:coiled-coil domain-containing protein [Romboutsia sp. 1001285H_161024_C4]|uniref:coiled-coil domain-containing protein n=1 Tax=Romboutsia sp. 1001285H_161024_C4 TaxID=2787109 RepID=UPI00189C0DB9|nr:hypothetical protein [Romboutsia sp. 1001285H_161024_C4]
MLKDHIEKIVNILSEKLKTNKSIFYYVVPIISVLGLLFFINSKAMFSNSGDMKIRSTPLNEIQVTDSLHAKILSRKYNPITKTVEFIIYTEDSNNIDKKDLKFELREQESPNVVIPTRYQKIDANYYVILANVKKNWNVLSLSFGYESADNSSMNEDLEDIDIDNLDTSTKDKKSLVSVVRIYSDANDIKSSSFLTEKKKSKYISEIMDLEIDFINKDIDKLNKKIEEDNSKMKDAESKIVELKNDIRYQTESEKNTTEANITKLKNLISSTRDLGEKRVDRVKELKEKINKLEQKKMDFGV